MIEFVGRKKESLSRISRRARSHHICVVHLLKLYKWNETIAISNEASLQIKDSPMNANKRLSSAWNVVYFER